MICLLVSFASKAQYPLHVISADKDTSFRLQDLKLQLNFANARSCFDYINKLPDQLRTKGFIEVSIDSIKYDSAFATIKLLVGKQKRWLSLRTQNIREPALIESGFSEPGLKNKPINFDQLSNYEQRILHYYEKNGYPFAAVFLDSIQFLDAGIEAALNVKEGPLYHIDSIRVMGDAKISNSFLQTYLGITNGSIYNIEKLQQVDKLIANLSYVREKQPSNLTMLGTGSILNLYLQTKKNSQFDCIIGIMPTNNETGKSQLTGDVNLNLKNSFGIGEAILLKWQELQVQSPRLNLGYQQPYIFKTPYGANITFDLFKKDSSYIQLNTQLGLQYLTTANRSATIFFQSQSNILLASGVDTNEVKLTKTLPSNIDVTSSNVGLNYKWTNTNYHLNPLKGNEFSFTGSVGLKKIKENSTITSLQDSGFNFASLYDSIKLSSYQFRFTASAAHYFPTGKQTTLKMAGNMGIYSSSDIFQNELFQIGGYKLLRGFDEESFFATKYFVGTAEYRYLFGLNSYFFAFVDMGWINEQFQSVNYNVQGTGMGIGINFETKLGLLNLSYAIGKRSDETFNLNQASKISFGYINYF